MVFERLIDENLLEKKAIYAFWFAIGYSMIGISFAKLLFPKDPAIVAVAFTSLMLLPTLVKIYDREEAEAKQSKKFFFRVFWKDESDFVRFYLCILAGVFIVYTIAAFLLPAFQVNYLFQSQMELRGSSGGAFSKETFDALLKNNTIFLLAIFFISFITGDGAIFLLVWNVSVWGTIFGVTARNAAFYAGTNPLGYLALTLVIVMPHAIIEILSYILGAMTGGMISKDLILEKGEAKKDMFKKSFYQYIIALAIGAIIFLLLGAVVETYVLTNVDTYREIIMQSYGVV